MLRLKAAESFVETSQWTDVTEKFGLRDVKRADFIRYWRRSGLKNRDKPKIFIKKNVRNHSYHQFYPVLAKIRINRIRINWGLLYLQWYGCCKTVTTAYSLRGYFALWWTDYKYRCIESLAQTGSH